MSGLDNLSDHDRAVLRRVFDPSATIGDVADDGDHFVEDDEDISEADKEAAALCREGVTLAETGYLAGALQTLDRAVERAPARAPAYNDRAQLLRLLKRDDDAMKDIDRVLELTEGRRTKTRALALCQRGVLLRATGEADAARAAFIEAAKLGSGFAKKQVVELNPYAAMCNQMLSQVLQGEKDIKI